MCSSDLLSAGRRKQVFQQYLPLLVGVSCKSVEIGIIVVYDYLLDNAELDFGNLAVRPFPNHQDKVLEEVYLLDIVFLPVDAKRIHRNRPFLGIGDILAAQILAQSLV